MNKTNGETNSETNNSFNWKANELILWMDNDRDAYKHKEAWIKNYTKKVDKGIFVIENGIIGMNTLRKQILKLYNNQVDEKITITKDETRTINIAFLNNILYSIWDNKLYLKQDDKHIVNMINILKHFY